MIRLRLPYPPSANRYWRHLVIAGQGRVVRSADAKRYCTEVGILAKAAGLRIPFDGRVALHLRLFPERPQDWARRARQQPDSWDDTVRCIDLGNCEKVLSDALNGIAWVDDKQLRRIVLERCEPDEHGARVEVGIDRVRLEPVAPVLFTDTPQHAPELF